MTMTERCARCGVECRRGGEPNPQARILALASGPVGVCPSCHITAFLQDPRLPFAALIAGREAEMLRWPALQAQVRELAQVGRADVSADEIDWERVLANWSLPHPTPAGRGRQGR